MKKSYLGILALAALGFAACTDSESLVDNSVNTNGETPENAINFTTYLGGAKSTRAGYVGNIATAELKTNSFGVFAYHTPLNASSQYTYWNTCTASDNATKLTTDYASASAPNFMYNQKVTYTSGDGTSGYVTEDGSGYWSYSPIKYWPNDFNSTDVDDQENDANDNPAYGSNYNGNVSFFAYAPYVEFDNSEVYGLSGTTPTTAANYGITAINSATTAAGNGSTTGNAATSDPILTYKLNQAYPVDLLWGTTGNNSVNVNNGAQTGGYTTWKVNSTDYISKYPVNVNMTKQKTNGVVDFLFKHALAGLGGGSNVSSGIGFQVMLDIDDMKGAEQGGKRESFTVSSTDDAYRTIVTIKNIEISNDLDDNGSIDNDETQFTSEGTFNLATGQWTSTTSNTEVSQTIGTGATTSYNAELSKKIAEYSEGTTTYLSTKTDNNYGAYFLKSYTDHPGVTEEAQNVYNDDTQSPFLIIPDRTANPKLRITVDYIVRTYDANLKGYMSEVEQIISKKVTFPTFEMNKHYNLIMHLGLTGVKFTASVSDWDEENFVNTDDDEELESSDIYLPRNVAGIQSVTVATPANQTFASTSSSSSDAQSLGAVTLTMSDGTTHVSTETTEQNNFAFSAGSDNIEVTANAGVPSVKFKAANTTLTPKEGTVNVTYGSATGPHTTTITVTQSPRKLTSTFTISSSTTTATLSTLTYTVTESDNTAVNEQTNVDTKASASYSVTKGETTTNLILSDTTLDVSSASLVENDNVTFTATFTPTGYTEVQTATASVTVTAASGGAKRR